MDEIKDGLYDYELARYALQRESEDQSYEIRLSRHRNNPWGGYLSIWLNEPEGTVSRSPGMNWEVMRAIAATLTEEADRQEAEWNALTDDERAEWLPKESDGSA